MKTKSWFYLPKLFTTAAIVLTFLFASQTRADTIALSFSGGRADPFAAATNGWAFSTANPSMVTARGYWDFDSDELAVSNQVGIWDTAGNLLLSGTVAAGTTDPLTNGFRFDSTISGVPLLAAGTYVIGGRANSSDLIASQVPVGNLSLASGINFLEARVNGGLGFSSPAFLAPFQDGAYFGPNFKFSAVPESGGTFLLLLGGVAGVFILRRLLAGDVQV